MDNIIVLPGARQIPRVEVADEKPEVDESFVEALEQMVSLAKEGKLHCFVGSGFTTDEHRITFWGGRWYDDQYRCLGSLQWLVQEYTMRIDQLELED